MVAIQSTTVDRTQPLRWGVIGLTACLTALTVLPPNAEAAIRGCRTDPAFTLSNGTVVDLGASLPNTDAAAVNHITYVLHVPAGTGIAKMIYSGGAFSGKETLTLVDDSASNGYSADTTVQTQTTGDSMAAHAIVLSTADSIQLAAARVTGTVGQTLVLKLNFAS